jgi:hypothetical protein
MILQASSAANSESGFFCSDAHGATEAEYVVVFDDLITFFVLFPRLASWATSIPSPSTTGLYVSNPAIRDRNVFVARKRSCDLRK